MNMQEQGQEHKEEGGFDVGRTRRQAIRIHDKKPLFASSPSETSSFVLIISV